MNTTRIRSACDRCHDMKMQCRTDGFGKDCARCLNANVTCNYSKSGKPGRPATKCGNATHQTLISLPTPSPSTGEDAWIHSTLNEYGSTMEGSTCVGNDHSGLSSKLQDGFLNACSGSCYPYLQFDVAEQFGPSDWAFEATVCPTQMDSEDGGVPENPNPPITTPKARASFPADRNWMEHLAYFQLKIARTMRSTEYLGSAQLEKEAAHVLQSSLEFLDLIQMLEAVAHECKQLHHPPPVCAVVFLQLSSMSLRLTEMHYWLYSSLYHCLQRRDTDFSAHDSAAGDGKECLSFSVAGVQLTPAPNLRLQILLQTAVHYLKNIHEIRGRLEALAIDAASKGQESPTLVPDMDKLVSEYQKQCMLKIQAVLDNLKGIFTASLNTVC